MKNRYIIFFILLPFFAWAQKNDSTLAEIINQGTFKGHARYFFMSTINEKALTDYYASAIGAGIGYESPEIRRFRFNISGFFIYNIGSSDLSRPDPMSNQLNRYEVGLFDIQDPDNRNDLDRLEELSLQYRIGKSFVRYGKMILKTPFINPQDGRMRPTIEQGFWSEINEIKDLKIQAGWITAMSPRSTVKWFSVGNSIGTYPVGVSPTGEKSTYSNNVESDGIGLLGVTYQKQSWSLVIWDTFLENVSNTVFTQLEAEQKRDEFKLYGGLQYTYQRSSGNGGNENASLQYFQAGTYTHTASSRVGIKIRPFDLNVNATAISDQGRFLMPREWGRDPFYTFLPRERNEGFGNVRAYSLNLNYTHRNSRLKLSAGIGEYHLPDVNNVKLNKYAMPSYRQMNADLRYTFGGFLKGADIQFLYVYKKGLGRDYENPRNIINKVNMSNFNFVLNYHFTSHHSHNQSRRQL